MLLGTQMLRLSGVAKTDEEAREKLFHALQSGAGLEKFRALLCALGGDGRCCDDPDSLLRARRTIDIPAPCDGYVSGMNALENLYEYCAENGVQLIFSHANEQPMRTMRRAGFVDLVGEDRFRPNIDDAIAYARTQLEQEKKAA